MRNRLDGKLKSNLMALGQRLKGELLLNHEDRLLYATDASIYQQTPLAITRPMDRNDCLEILNLAAQQQIPVIPRAGGTSLAGQVVGNAVILDVSRYMTSILAVDREEQTAHVEPGVILESLNTMVKPMGLKFAPDPSTLNRCTISGIIGNNAWGAHAPLYGSTRDHVLETDLALSTGELIQTHPLDMNAFTEKRQLSGKEGDIYRCVNTLIDRHQALIAQRYPNKQDIICNAGYALHELAAMRPWNKQGPDFNLSSLLCGSEGTLGIVTRAKVKLVPLPTHTKIIGAHFQSIDDALNAVSVALQFRAGAVELLDDYLLNLTLHNREQARNRFWIQGNPKAVLIMEFSGENPGELNDRIHQTIGELKSRQLGYTYNIVEADQVARVWSMRRAALGLLMGMPGRKKAATFIEDSAVPVHHLAQFTRQVQALMQQPNTSCVYYGSVSMGLIHLRPLLDLHDPEDRQTFKALANEVAELLIQYHGTMSAKHGDGIVRSPFIEKFFGPDIVQCLQTIKTCFDPQRLLNPGKIVDPGPIDRSLRYTATDRMSFTTGFSWQPDGLLAAAEQCNGAAACRKLAGSGTMCPSYMATREEQHSTRGRANTIRQMLQRHRGFTPQSVATINESLKYCVSCKGCRSECPANVDMARLKAECLYQTHKLKGTTWRTLLLSQLDTINRLGSRTPALSNLLLGLPVNKPLLGFHRQRVLPKLSPVKLSRWFKGRTPHPNAGTAGHIIILNDLFSEYYEPQVGRSAIELLERWGFSVSLSPCFASVRLCISLGLLDQARRRLAVAIDWLQTHANDKDYLLGLEPSELLTYRDEAKGLLQQSAHLGTMRHHLIMQNRFLLFDEFVSEHQKSFTGEVAFHPKPIDIALHIHCHQKALSEPAKSLEALRIIPHATIETIPSGCCGMAGLFGYGKESYEVSKQIGELVLMPYIRDLPRNTKIVAAGASCRQQIKDLLNINAYHPAQLIHQQMVKT